MGWTGCRPTRIIQLLIILGGSGSVGASGSRVSGHRLGTLVCAGSGVRTVSARRRVGVDGCALVRHVGDEAAVMGGGVGHGLDTTVGKGNLAKIVFISFLKRERLREKDREIEKERKRKRELKNERARVREGRIGQSIGFDKERQRERDRGKYSEEKNEY